MADNIIYDRGKGNWSFFLYKPEQTIGPYIGQLQITKDFHTVNNEGLCLISVPSPNVAFVENISEED
jgi:hypothetical protein